MWYVFSLLCVSVFALPNEWMNKICEKSSISLKSARVLIFLTFFFSSHIKVSTSTGVISHFVNLQVVVPEAFILGSGELHVDMGSAINLVCIIEKVRTRDSTGFCSPFSYSKKEEELVEWHTSGLCCMRVKQRELVCKSTISSYFMCTFISVWIYIMLFHYMISALDLLGCVVLVARLRLLLLLLTRAEHFANHFYDLVRCSFESLVFFYFAQVSSSLMFSPSYLNGWMRFTLRKDRMRKSFITFFIDIFYMSIWLDETTTDERCSNWINAPMGVESTSNTNCVIFMSFPAYFSFSIFSPALAANVNDEIMLRKTFEIDGVQYKSERRMLQERSVHTVTVTLKVVYFPISNSLPSELHEKKRGNQ